MAHTIPMRTKMIPPRPKARIDSKVESGLITLTKTKPRKANPAKRVNPTLNVGIFPTPFES